MQDTIDVVVTWGGTALAVERLPRGEKLTIGPGGGDARHFLCDHPSIPSDAFVLAEHRADGVVIVRAAADMDLMVNGRAVDLPEVALERGARADVAVGPLSIAIAADTRAATAIARTRDLVDGRLVRVSGIAMALHAGFVVALLFTRAPDPLDDLAGSAQAWRTTVSTIMRPSKARALDPVADEASPASARHAAAKARPKSPGAKERPDNHELAKNAIAQMFGGGDATSSVFGDRGTLEAALGDLHGAPTAMGGDVGVRRGPGGAGEGGRTIGALTSGPIGDGECKDCDVALTTRKRVRPEVIAETPVHSDGLSREEIQRVLNRVMAQIKYCYEKELNREPALEGKLVMSWVIGKSGLVTSSKAASSSLQRGGGAAVDSCVDRVISRLRFPAPRGGTEQVVVTYPFVFSSAGN